MIQASYSALDIVIGLSVASLLIVWVAYPILMGLLASARSAPAQLLPGPDESVTVVFATRESPGVIRARVENLLDTSFPADRLDVIVTLDAAGSHATPEQLQDIAPNVRVIVGDLPGGKAAAVNAGMRIASGRSVVFADSFQAFTRDTIPRLVGALRAPGVAAVSGRLVLAPAEDAVSPIHLYWAYETWLRGCEARWHSCVGVFGPVNALRTEHWSPLRAGLILDDVYTPMRLVLEGHRVGFVYNALAIDTRLSRPDSEYRRKVRTLTGNIQLCRWMPAVLNPFANPIWVQFVCHKLGRLITPYAIFFATVSGLAMVVQRLASMPTLVPALLLGALLIAVSSSALRQGVTRLASWILSMQAAVVMATVNGVRGRWDVWTR